MVVYAGQGDVRRSMALLWRASDAGQGSKPGPKPGLSVDAIVAAAVEVADADGMVALSMRAVGDRLGRTAMALYTYVPNKSELLDLMYDAVLAELPNDYDHSGGWRATLTRWAGDLWEFYLRHPWMLHISQARPVLGPNEYVMQNTVIGILAKAGLKPKDLRRILGAVFQLVRGSAQIVAEARVADVATGQSEDDWWFARSAMLEEVAPDFAARFPALVTLAEAGAYEMDDDTTPYLQREATEMYRTGLEVLLDGVEARAGDIPS